MRRLLFAFLCFCNLGLPAWAETMDERIAMVLEAEGYRIVTQYRTWLGRIYVVAETDDVRREMVFNPATGEVLRDYAVTKGAPLAVAGSDDDDDDDTASLAATASDDLAGIATATTRGNDRNRSDAPASEAEVGTTSVILVAPVVIPPSD